ncbi:MAG: hypothetical protein JOY77_05760 [Alphaproteobacteria bacterium]|nr:hypothetical protein [Alphaproteobacteria bacterium]
MKKVILGLSAAVVLAASVAGCSTAPVQTAYGPMPQFCMQNNTATGGLLGAALGAGVGAALGRGRGAAIGAASGAVLGGVTGARADQECRQIALQRMIEMAAAQQAAAQQAAAQQLASQQTTYRPQPQPHEVVLASVEYVSPSNGHRH